MSFVAPHPFVLHLFISFFLFFSAPQEIPDARAGLPQNNDGDDDARGRKGARR
jgi:hypothetical protein